MKSDKVELGINRHNKFMGKLKLTRIEGHTFIGGLISKDSTVLDLGANHGGFSLEIRRRFGCALHAVEPTPDLANALRSSNEVTVYEAAVSAKGSDLLFRIDTTNSESSALVSEPGENVITVPGTTLDSLLTNIGHVDLLKIDVEGSEIEILGSVSEDLLTNVDQVTVEFHDFKKDSGFTPELFTQVCNRMKKMGFDMLIMSYWTKGDVLFVNKNCRPLRVSEKIALEVKGRWIPGVIRTMKRFRTFQT